jgi:hypothetical protein
LKRRITIEKALYPQLPGPEFLDTWARDYSNRILEIVWQAYDLLAAELISKHEITRAILDLENSLTEELVRRIEQVLSGYEPYRVICQCAERETMFQSGVRPPTYDIAFVLRENERLKWPIEAKVIEKDTPTSLSDYCNDLNQNFLCCRYAPYSSEGAMVGYLLAGEADTVFSIIETKLPSILAVHSIFDKRSHRYSTHERNHKTCIELKSPASFQCHHLILKMR